MRAECASNCIAFAISGSALPMPPELMELYNLYQMEIETRENNEKDQNLLVEAEKILRVSGFFNLICNML